MMPLLASSENAPVLLRFLGRLHPALVHFPIALLALAALLEAAQLVRRKPGPSPATAACLLVGAASAVLASAFGWLLDEFEHGGTSDRAELHQWLGLATTAGALIAVLLLRSASRSAAGLGALRLALWTSAGLVGLTGYLGGELVFGKNHLLKDLFATIPAATSSPGSEGGADLVNDVAPIFQEHCLRCHSSAEVVRGKLDLADRLKAFKGGRSGPCIVPGQPGQSLLYTMLIEPEAEAHMPPLKEKQLTAEQIRTIRQWIAEGADWPEGVK